MDSKPIEGDVSEVEEVVSDEEQLPRQEPGSEAESTGIEREIRKLQNEELSLSDAEIRSRQTYNVSLAVGMVKPWQVYSLEFGYIHTPTLIVGFFAGTGQFRTESSYEEKSWDMEFRSRSFGGFGRWYFTGLEGLAFEGSLSHTVFDGRLTPRGTDLDDPDSGPRISTGWSGSATAVAAAAVLSWPFEGGQVIEWTPVGLYRIISPKSEFTHTSDAADAVVDRLVFAPGFYGIVNVRLGYSF